MPKYATLFSYTSESWARMMENPGDRAAAVRTLSESTGVRMEAFYWMFGEYDGLAIFDAPDSAAIAATIIAVAGSGALKSLVTHELISMEDAQGILDRAQQAREAYALPGQ